MALRDLFLVSVLPRLMSSQDAWVICQKEIVFRKYVEMGETLPFPFMVLL